MPRMEVSGQLYSAAWKGAPVVHSVGVWVGHRVILAQKNVCARALNLSPATQPIA